MNGILSNRQTVLEYIKNKYGTVPEYLWFRYPRHAVLRHYNNRKWFAIIMPIKKKTIGLLLEDADENEYTDIMNVKCLPSIIYKLLQNYGYFPAFHMNKQHWISVLLDGSVPMNDIYKLIDRSFELTK